MRSATKEGPLFPLVSFINLLLGRKAYACDKTSLKNIANSSFSNQRVTEGETRTHSISLQLILWTAAMEFSVFPGFPRQGQVGRKLPNSRGRISYLFFSSGYRKKEEQIVDCTSDLMWHFDSPIQSCFSFLPTPQSKPFR